jgi:hypothetical protein
MGEGLFLDAGCYRRLWSSELLLLTTRYSDSNEKQEGVETSDEEPENCSFDTGLVRTAEGLKNGEDVGGSGRPFPMS